MKTKKKVVRSQESGVSKAAYHAPTPWRRFGGMVEGYGIVSADGHTVVAAKTLTSGDADLIVNGVNSHGELVAALKGALAQLTGPAGVWGDGRGADGKKTGLSHQEFNELCDSRIAAARAAIAKADGGQAGGSSLPSNDTHAALVAGVKELLATPEAYDQVSHGGDFCEQLTKLRDIVNEIETGVEACPECGYVPGDGAELYHRPDPACKVCSERLRIVASDGTNGKQFPERLTIGKVDGAICDESGFTMASPAMMAEIVRRYNAHAGLVSAARGALFALGEGVVESWKLRELFPQRVEALKQALSEEDGKAVTH